MLPHTWSEKLIKLNRYNEENLNECAKDPNLKNVAYCNIKMQLSGYSILVVQITANYIMIALMHCNKNKPL